MLLSIATVIGHAAVEPIQVPVADVPAPASPATPMPASKEFTFFPGEDTYHQTGRRSGTREWEVDVSFAPGTFLTYGPYTTEVPPGRATVTYALLLDNVDADSSTILTLDVFDASTARVLVSRVLKRRDFEAPFLPKDFSLSFDNPPGSRLDATVPIAPAAVTTSIVDSNEDPLGAFWQGQAQLRYQRTIAWPTVQEGSGWTAVKDGIWYIFNRDVEFAPRPSYCDRDYARTVVRMSADQGRTWSDKQVAVEPSSSDPSSNCAVLDGSSYFDSDSGSWHMLAQCLGTSRAWRLCHYTRNDPSPMGSFVPDARNPVVEIGQLWKEICAGQGKSCPTTTTIDEGTPDIVKKSNGFFYVTFHGYDPDTQSGYRGIAKTPDFREWTVDSRDLPDDALFSARDCQSWNPGCIGGGEATALISGRTPTC